MYMNLTQETVDTLIRLHDSDMALVYLYFCKTGHSDVESVSKGLVMPRKRTAEALERLEIAGLIGESAKENNAKGNSEEISLPPPEKASTSKMYDENFAALVLEIELVMQHQASVPDLQKLLMIYESYKMAPETLMLLLHYVEGRYNERYAGARHPSMSAIDREAKLWKNNGVTDMDSAEKYIQEVQKKKEVEMEIKDAIGIMGRDLTDTERQFIWSWIDLGFSPKMIAAAYDRALTSKHTYNPAYVNGILRNWRAKGILTVAELTEKELVKKGKYPPYTSPTIDPDKLKAIIDRMI